MPRIKLPVNEIEVVLNETAVYYCIYTALIGQYLSRDNISCISCVRNTNIKEKRKAAWALVIEIT